MNTNEALLNYTLRLGDSSLILAQRLCEWTGHGPYLEEDLALTNISLDLFGRAKSLLDYAAKLEGKGRTEDDLAFLRSEREYFNNLITELPNGDYAKTIMRQALVDCFDFHFYSALTESKDETLAGIAAKSIKEIAYHKRHSFSWAMRFGNGTHESAERLQNGFTEVWPFAYEMFEMTAVDETLLNAGIAVNMTEVKQAWEKEIMELLPEINITIPEGIYMQTGSRKGLHTEHLGHLLSEMQALPRMHPGATW
jgi:ring-1,2-phenylacetyl-CoA epoxidase subunit PaaC